MQITGLEKTFAKDMYPEYLYVINFYKLNNEKMDNPSKNSQKIYRYLLMKIYKM